MKWTKTALAVAYVALIIQSLLGIKTYLNSEGAYACGYMDGLDKAAGIKVEKSADLTQDCATALDLMVQRGFKP